MEIQRDMIGLNQSFHGEKKGFDPQESGKPLMSKEGLRCFAVDQDMYQPFKTYWRQTPRSPTPKEHTQTISYTCHQRRNENTGCTQGF